MSELEAKVVWKGTTKPIEFTYRNFDGEKTRRRVDVNQVLYDSNADEVYLKGFCHLRNSERSFKVSNIETMLKCGSKRFYWEEWLRWELDIPTESFQQPISSVSNNSGSGININLRTGEIAPKKPTSFGKRVDQWFMQLPLVVRVAAIGAAIGIFWVVSGASGVRQKSESVKDASSSSIKSIEAPAATPVDTRVFYSGPLSDCQLAAQIVEADAPVLVALVDQIGKAKKTPEYSYQDFAQWRINGFNAELDAVVVSQPSAFPLDYQASRLANDVIVRNHLLANAAYRYLKNGRQDGDQKIGEQWQAIRTNILEINTLCPGALDNLNITP